MASVAGMPDMAAVTAYDPAAPPVAAAKRASRLSRAKRLSLARALNAARSYIASRVRATTASSTGDGDGLGIDALHADLARTAADDADGGLADDKPPPYLGHRAKMWTQYEDYLNPATYDERNLKTSFAEEASYRMYMEDMTIPSDEPELLRRWQRNCGARYTTKHGNKTDVPRDLPALSLVAHALPSAEAENMYRHNVYTNHIHRM